jgi:hypothetical protein
MHMRSIPYKQGSCLTNLVRKKQRIINTDEY